MSMFHSTSACVFKIQECVKAFNLDGVLWNYSYFCRAMGGHPLIFKKFVEEDPGVPLLALECDQFDTRDFSRQALVTRIETFADMIAVPIQDIGPLSLEVDEDPEPVSSTCVTYANSMALQLMRKEPRNRVLASYCFSIAWRDSILVNRLANLSGDGTVEKDLAITGGVAKNKGIVSRIERELGFEALPLKKGDPQIAGAIGAAILATDMVTSGGG